MEVTCAILSGGRSRRMGQDKATVLVRDKALINRTYEVARPIFDDVVIVSSFHQAFTGIKARVVKDIMPIPGSLTGIVSALLASQTPYVFVLGCDMPFLQESAIRYVISQIHGEDVIIPRAPAGFEPMHALYRRSCISPMLTALERGHLKVTALFPLFVVKTIPPNNLFFRDGVSVFTNINTREDLRRAEQAL
jgi:molybdopterin-guanine dinucleotide biosynthesis protein A